MQQFLARDRWDTDTGRDELRGHFVDHLGEPDAVLVLDEMDFVNNGRRIENHKITLLLAYASRQEYAFINR